MIRLGINIDHIATLRQARKESYPDPVQAAVLAQMGGADNITCHLREDRRHIQDRDVKLLRETIQLPLNFEMAATESMITFACGLHPHAVTLVPEKREELTTEGGLDVARVKDQLKAQISRLKEEGIVVALFVEADPKVFDMCRDVGADAVEIHTGTFCRLIAKTGTSSQGYELVRPLQKAATHAASLGLQVHFGHGLHYQNAAWLQWIKEAEEANIGHAVVAQAVFVGLAQAVREMKACLNDRAHRPFVRPDEAVETR